MFNTSACDRRYPYGSSRHNYDFNLDPTTYVDKLGFKKKIKNLHSKAVNLQKNELKMGMKNNK